MYKAVFSFVSLSLVLVIAGSANAQGRDHLTKEEIEIVRDVQDVDLRMKVFSKAIDRRLLALEGTDGLSEKEKKRLEKDTEKWGALRTGKRLLLLSDIAGILNESIDKFEDVYERDPKNELVPYAYHNLADYVDGLVPKLNALMTDELTGSEKSAIRRALKNCSDILKVRNAIPKPKKKRPKRKPQN